MISDSSAGEAGAAATITAVFKFGGTSVADGARIRHVAGLVAAEDPPPVVVVSAMAGVTDRLETVARTLTGPERGASGVQGILDSIYERHLEALDELEPTPEERSEVAREIQEIVGAIGSGEGAPTDRAAELKDSVLAVGEDLSARLLALAIRRLGRGARVVDARDLIRTDHHFGRATPDDKAVRGLAASRLLPMVQSGEIAVVPGFVGATADGRTTTLGRGGSDFTAALLGYALDATRVHIWTDVDGVLSGDPNSVSQPRTLGLLGFEEAVELSHFGAGVIHPTAAKYAISKGVSLRIRNTFRPDLPGTLILPDRWGSPEIAAVAHRAGAALIKVRSDPSGLPYGFLARVFEVLARHELPVDLVATSHASTAFTLDEGEEIEAVSTELAEFAEVDVLRELATVTVVGRGLLEEPGVDAMVFQAVGATSIYLISQASDVSLSFLVAQTEAPEVVARIHAALIERHRRTERGESELRRSGT